MDNLLKSVFDLPDVSFIDNDSLDAMMQRLVANYEKRYKEVTGQTISLGAADPVRVQLYAVALDLFQIEQYVDRAGKQDLLKYSYGEYLDNLAGNRRVTRQRASAARTTIRFTLSETRDYAIGIPAGTRTTNGDGVYFKTEEYAEVPAGAKFADIESVCTEAGVKGNNFLKGQISVLVDPLPYVESVENITDTSDGTDLEDDTSLAERTYIAPSGYSMLPAFLVQAQAQIDAHNTDPQAHPAIKADFNAMDARMSLMELRYNTEVSGNPFTATFEDLSKLRIEGVWNAAQKRVEF